MPSSRHSFLRIRFTILFLTTTIINPRHISLPPTNISKKTWQLTRKSTDCDWLPRQHCFRGDATLWWFLRCRASMAWATRLISTAMPFMLKSGKTLAETAFSQCWSMLSIREAMCSLLAALSALLAIRWTFRWHTRKLWCESFSGETKLRPSKFWMSIRNCQPRRLKHSRYIRLICL